MFYKIISFIKQIPHASRIPTSPQRATFLENEYGRFMCVYGMSCVSSEILKAEPRKHKAPKSRKKLQRNINEARVSQGHVEWT